MKETAQNPLEQLIIETFAQTSQNKFNYKQLAAKIHVFDKAGRENVKKIIDDFVDKKILLSSGRGKYKIHPKYLKQEQPSQNYIVGEIRMNRVGTAFVTPDDNSLEDVFIAEKNQGKAFHTDKVKVLLLPMRRGKRLEGQVVEVLERGKSQLVGTLQQKKGIYYLQPDNPLFKQDIIIPNNSLKGAKMGDKIIAVTEELTSNAKTPIGKVVQVLGKPGNNDVEMNSILAESGYPLNFSKKVEEEAQHCRSLMNEKEYAKRRDFRTVTTFTIDPADAKDFDDAISFEPLENGLYRVGVHIADVSFFVKQGSLLDQEAYKRGTSVYLVDRTIPMLPEVISNELCSLRPHEDKFCYSAVFDLDDNGKVHKEWFGRAIINSNRRFNYDEAQKVIETEKGDLNTVILKLHQIASVLRKKRFENRAINFETEEIKFRLDKEGKPVGVYLKIQKEANFLIEEFMLLANQKVAEKIGNKKNQEDRKTFIYRVHDKPFPEKLETFKNFVKTLGYELKTTSPKTLAKSFNEMFAQTKSKTEYNMLSRLSVRLMPKAIYTTDNIGHYGLGFPFYTHFTSPIRRYPDLMVHRLLDTYFHNAASANQGEYEEFCKHSSKMEQLAVEAERASIKYKQAEYFMEKIGQTFDAVISGISKWGVYAEINETKGEGMIPIRAFDDDFYFIDEENYTLKGLHHGKSYRFGDPIRVRIVEVDMKQKQMTFDLNGL